jgi:hypothetical protein
MNIRDDDIRELLREWLCAEAVVDKWKVNPPKTYADRKRCAAQVAWAQAWRNAVRKLNLDKGRHKFNVAAECALYAGPEDQEPRLEAVTE